MGRCRSIGQASASCCVWYSGGIFRTVLFPGIRLPKNSLHISPHAEGVVVLLLVSLHDVGQDLHTCAFQPVLLNERSGNTLRIVFHERSPLVPPPASATGL
jgi:hypothetical protein